MVDVPIILICKTFSIIRPNQCAKPAYSVTVYCFLLVFFIITFIAIFFLCIFVIGYIETPFTIRIFFPSAWRYTGWYLDSWLYICIAYLFGQRQMLGYERFVLCFYNKNWFQWFLPKKLKKKQTPKISNNFLSTLAFLKNSCLRSCFAVGLSVGSFRVHSAIIFLQVKENYMFFAQTNIWSP
jgi:hypothetical protein